MRAILSYCRINGKKGLFQVSDECEAGTDERGQQKKRKKDKKKKCRRATVQFPQVRGKGVELREGTHTV